jgi:uncharacterized protein
MKIIRFADLRQSPWKNGGGVTREIASARTGDDLVWRLSIADVDRDGPFSSFGGLLRVLTVIGGNGMELLGPHTSLQADFAVPVHFDGEVAIAARLKDGPVRDLNLIYDPRYCTGAADVLHENAAVICAPPKSICAIHCITGAVGLQEAGRLDKGDTALLECGESHVELAAGSSALLISISFPL